MVNEETIRVGDNPDRVRGLDYGMITVIRLLWGDTAVLRMGGSVTGCLFNGDSFATSGVGGCMCSTECHSSFFHYIAH